MIIKKSTQNYLSRSTQGYGVYDDATWALTNTIAMRLPSDYMLGDQHMFSKKAIPHLLESSGFYDSANLVDCDIELWREKGLAYRKNIFLPFNEQYCYQSKFIKLFNWRMSIFKVSLKTGILYLFDMYSGALIGIILPMKKIKEV